jgi:hypothetical protein
MLDHAAKRIPKLRAGGRILEIGAGHGFFARACRDRGLEYEGVELNAPQAEKLRGLGFSVVSASVPPLPEGPAVDCVWMSHVLEHAKDPWEAREMMACTRARVRSGGAVVVICPEIRSWRSEFWATDWSHGYPTAVRRVRQLACDVGLEIVDARTLVATVSNPAAVALIGFLNLFIPYRLIDAVSTRLGGRDVGHSYMGTFGWKQMCVIARWT